MPGQIGDLNESGRGDVVFLLTVLFLVPNVVSVLHLFFCGGFATRHYFLPAQTHRFVVKLPFLDAQFARKPGAIIQWFVMTFSSGSNCILTLFLFLDEGFLELKECRAGLVAASYAPGYAGRLRLAAKPTGFQQHMATPDLT